ncbi:hypothetical protein [Prauserella muralis]|uniref:hypothetical protein n=1 Tax=Prauserella muralis TaxID=588067 RepID=UPI000DD2B74C|nr:hypothetical protein [Prauserella muralis]
MTRRIGVLGASIAAAVALLTAVPTQAATGRDFGAHVSSCARTMGLDGDHNPGRHSGYAGWDGHTCP